MTNAITITVAMMIAAAALLAFTAMPLQAMAQVSAGGTVGTLTKETDLDLSDIAEPPKTSVPEPDIPDIPKPDLSATAEPELPDIPEPELPAIPELSDIPKPEL
jgi:Cornifin (SPRR) family